MLRFDSDEEVAAIAYGVVNCSWPKERWTHAAHLALALWFLSQYSPEEALSQIRQSIRTYNLSTGVANTGTSGYHETITQASLRVAHLFWKDRRGQPLFGICNELIGSPLGRSDWIFRHWSRDVLFGKDARQRWVDPDLEPLLR